MTNLRIPNFWDGFFVAFQPMDEDPMDLLKIYKPKQIYEPKQSVKDSLRNDWINICTDFRKAYDKVTAQHKTEK